MRSSLTAASASSCANARSRLPDASVLRVAPFRPSRGRFGVSRADPEAPRTVARATTREVENVDRNYCNDFVCESSPAVEQTVKQFARDLERGRANTAIYQADVKYSDGFRGFTGAEKLTRTPWLRENLKAVKVTVERMRMLDKGTAEITWRAAGTLGVAPVDLGFTSTIELNLLTGRVTSVKETMDTSRCLLPVAMMVRANRTTWAAKQVSMDASQSLNSIADSLSSMDESNNVYRNPNDPTKFFQQQDNTFNDAVQLTLFVAVLYLLYQALYQVNT